MITVAFHPGLRESARTRHLHALLALPDSFVVVDGPADITVAEAATEAAADVQGARVVVGVPRSDDRPMAVDTPALWDPAVADFVGALGASTVYAVDAVAWCEEGDGADGDLLDSLDLLRAIVAKLVPAESIDLSEAARLPSAASISALVGGVRVALSAVRTREPALRARIRITGEKLSGVLEVADGSSARPSRWRVTNAYGGLTSVDSFTSSTGWMWRSIESRLLPS